MTEVNEKERARQLIDELSRMLVEVESLDALVAAAHLDAAIVTLADAFNLERNASETDYPEGDAGACP